MSEKWSEWLSPLEYPEVGNYIFVELKCPDCGELYFFEGLVMGWEGKLIIIVPDPKEPLCNTMTNRWKKKIWGEEKDIEVIEQMELT